MKSRRMLLTLLALAAMWGILSPAGAQTPAPSPIAAPTATASPSPAASPSAPPTTALTASPTLSPTVATALSPTAGPTATPTPIPTDPALGPEAGARAYLDALVGRDFERAVGSASDLAVLALGVSREEYRRKLEALDGRGFRVWSWELVDARPTGPDDAVVRVVSKLQQNALSQPQTLAEELPMHREYGVWRVGPAGLVDYRTLDVAPQTANGVTVRPLRLIRFKSYFQVTFSVANDGDRAVLWGYGGEKPGVCQIAGQVVDAGPYKATVEIGPGQTVPSANLIIPGAHAAYPTSCDALSFRRADPNSPSAPDVASPPWSYHFDLPAVPLPAGSPVASAPPLTLAGHTDLVAGVAVSPDGRTVATGSADRTVRLWDALTGQPLRTLAGHPGFVTSVAFSPDGATLASAGEDGAVKLWDVASGRILRTLPGHAKGAVSVAFSPDGATLASGGLDRAVRLWDVATGRELRALTGHSDAVSDVAFSPDGVTLASGSRDQTVRLWDPAAGSELRALEGHTEAVQAVVFSPDGKTLASAGGDLAVRLWDVAAGREIRRFAGRPTAFGLAFSPDGRMLATAGSDRVVRVWDAAIGQDVYAFTGHREPAVNLAFFPDGKRLVSVGGDGTGKVWTLPR